MPVIPMCLVNGSEGIGTGWSSSVPNFNPRDIIRNIRHLIKEEPQEKLVPFYFGFSGRIEEDCKKPGSYTVYGQIERTDDTTLCITELPIRKWTQDYKEFLEGLMIVEEKGKKADKSEAKDGSEDKTKDAKREPDIKDFRENHTDTTVSFTITATKEKIDAFELEKGGLCGKFKLASKISTTNMHLFDENCHIMKFDTPESILEKFFNLRLSYYDKRKDHLLNIMRRELLMISNKARFIQEVCDGVVVINNRKRSDILSDLKKRNYELFPKEIKKSKSSQVSDPSDDEANDHGPADSELSKGYDYLLGMKMWSLTLEKVQELKKQLQDKTHELSILEMQPPSAIWETDLQAIEIALDERDKYHAAAAEEENKAQMKNNKRKAVKTAKRSKAKSLEDEDESEFETQFLKKKSGAPKVQPLGILVDLSESTTKIQTMGSSKSAIMKGSMSSGKAALSLKHDDSDSDVELSLIDRVQKKMNSSSHQLIPSTAPTNPKKSPRRDEEDMNFDAYDFEPASLTPAPKKGKMNKTKASGTSNKEKVSVPKAVRRAIAVDSSSEDDDSVVVDMSAVVEKPTSRGRSVRERKAVTYTIDLGSDDDDSDFD